MSRNPVRRPWSVALMVGAFTMSAGLLPAQQSSSTSAEQELQAAHHQLVEASKARDKEAVARYLADDLAWTVADGSMLNKQARVEATPPVKNVQIDKVILSGTRAIVMGTTQFDSGPDARFLQQWVNQDGHWMVRVHQSTYIKPEGASSTSPATEAASRPTGTAGSTMLARTVAPTLTSADEKAVWKAEVGLFDTYANGDATTYSRLTADDFLRVTNDGRLLSRSDWIDTLRPNAARPTKAPIASDVQIKMDDDMAVAILRLQPFDASGNPMPVERQTRIFAKRDGAWQQVAAIATPIGK